MEKVNFSNVVSDLAIGRPCGRQAFPAVHRRRTSFRIRFKLWISHWLCQRYPQLCSLTAEIWPTTVRCMKLILKSVLLLLAGVVFFGGVGIYATWAPDLPVSALQERWAKAPSTFIAVDGLQVHLRDEGPRMDGAAGAPDSELPIVLLHGTSASLHTWDGWVATLASERRVIRFDLAGFGLTGPPADGNYRPRCRRQIQTRHRRQGSSMRATSGLARSGLKHVHDSL